MQHSAPSHLRCLSALLALGLPIMAQAPDSDTLELDLFELLNTHVVSASKREQKLINSPQAIEVLTGDEIRQMGIFRIQDALKLMTGVDIVEADNEFSVVGMRGVMQQGQPRTVQVLIDGVPLYNAFASSVDINNLPLPIDLIDRVEVVRGPSSTLYGANAVVGVITITTKKVGVGTNLGARGAKADKGTSRWSTTLDAGNGSFGVTAGYQGASFGNSNRTAAEVGHYVGEPLFTKITDGQVFRDSSRFDHYIDASHQSAGFARFDWKNDHTSLWASAGEGFKKLGTSQDLLNRNYDTKAFLFGWRETWASSFATEVRLHQTRTTFQFHIKDESAKRYNQLRVGLGGTPLDISGNYTFCDITTSQAEVQANLDLSQDLHFVLGADFRKVDAKKAVFLGLNKDETNKASGAFVSMDWTFLEAWTLSLGVRGEKEDLGGSRTSPRATLVWTPSTANVLRLGYFTSTRSPQLTEQKVNYFYAYQTESPSNTLATHIIPNELLKPEKSDNIELGYRQSIGAVTVDLTLYQMKIKDQITQSYFTTLYLLPGPNSVPESNYQYQNKGRATNKGAELALTWAVQKGWKVGLNGRALKYTQDDLTIKTGKPDSWKGEFSYAPKNVVTAWTRFNKGGFSGYLDVQRVSDTHVEALTATSKPAYDERPAYVQCDVQLGYEFVKGVSLSLYGRNAAREFTFQGATGPDRPSLYQVQRREMGAVLSFHF